MKRAADPRNASVMRMRRTIEDLTDLRAIHMGVLTIDRQPTDLVALVEHVVRGLELHERNRIVIECRRSPTVLADAARVSRVIWRLLNLHLTTATPSTTIRIVIDGIGDRATIGLFAGSTLASSAMRLVLDTANQRHRSRGEQLGVLVARSAIEAHGGALTAYDQPGKGTWLVIMLPAVTTAARDRHP